MWWQRDPENQGCLQDHLLGGVHEVICVTNDLPFLKSLIIQILIAENTRKYKQGWEKSHVLLWPRDNTVNTRMNIQDIWVAQWLSLCFWLRMWSRGPGIESHIGLLAGSLLLLLSVSLMNKWIKSWKKNTWVNILPDCFLSTAVYLFSPIKIRPWLTLTIWKPFLFFFKILFIHKRQEREADTQSEGEAGPMQGAWPGTQSGVFRITPRAEGCAKPLGHWGCSKPDFLHVPKTYLSMARHFFDLYLSIFNGSRLLLPWV